MQFHSQVRTAGDFAETRCGLDPIVHSVQAELTHRVGVIVQAELSAGGCQIDHPRAVWYCLSALCLRILERHSAVCIATRRSGSQVAVDVHPLSTAGKHSVATTLVCADGEPWDSSGLALCASLAHSAGGTLRCEGTVLTFTLLLPISSAIS